MKKLFSIVATFMLLAGLLPTTNVLGASYSAELEGAYDYAYGMGITTMSSIDNANMYGSLTRIALAKMVSNYVLELGLQTPDTSKACSFTDVSEALDAQYGNGVTNACQLGLMGVGITSFRPNDEVTRAEFGTVLSRAIWGDANNGSDPYYVDHLNALKDADVMTNISNPNMKEVRGYVMLMMQRADENGVANDTPAICSTPENILACSLGLDSCPAECMDTEEEDEEEVEVKAGTMTVSLGDSLDNNSEIPNDGIVKFASIKFKASSDDVNLKTVEIKKLGLAAIEAGTRVWFEKDGVRVSGKSTFTSEGNSIVSFAPVYKVKAGNTETLDLYVQLSAYALNTNLQFTSVDFDTTAEDVNGSFTTPILRTANYTVAPVEIAAIAGGTVSNISDNGVELGAFSVENKDLSSETRDVRFKSITLRQNGDGDLSNLGDIVLERNGDVVASDPIVDGRDITFSIGDVIEDGVTATYYIKAVVDNVERAQDTYQFQVRYTTDLSVEEKNTSFRSTVTFGLDLDGLTTDLDLDEYGIEGGDITFTRDSNIALAANAAAGSDVVLMKGTIKTNGAITFEDPTLDISTLTPALSLDSMFSVIYLQIGSSIFSYVPVALDVQGDAIEFIGSATVDGTSNVKLYGKLKNTAAGVLKFADLRLTSFNNVEYVSNGYDANTAIGSMGGVTLTIEDTALNVTRVDGIGSTTIAAGTSNMTVYKLNLTSTQGNGVKINRATFDTVNTVNTQDENNVFLTLYVDGVAVSTKTLATAANTVVFDGFSKTVDATHPVTLEVKATFAEAFAVGDFQVTLNALNATDALTSVAVTTYAKPAGAVLTIGTASAALAVSNDAPQAKLLLSPSVDNQIAAFKLTATNDSVKLYDLKVTLPDADAANLSNFRVANATGEAFATATSITSAAGTTTVLFSSISNAPTIARDTSATYLVLANVNSNITTAAVTATVANVGTTVRASNGTVVAVDAGADIVGYTHAVSENTVVVAKIANPSKSIASSAIRFTVTASGKDAVTITDLPLTLNQAGYTMGAVAIYRNSVSAQNLVTLSGTNASVDAGTTSTFIVAYPGTVFNGVATSQDWSLSVDDIEIDGVLVGGYSNVGLFPMTEVK